MVNRSIKIVLFSSLVLGLFASQLFFDPARYLPIPRIVSLLRDAGPLSPLLFISMMAIAVVVSPLPSLPLDLAAGSFFGPLMGTLYSAIGGLIGAVLSFLIARFVGRELIERYLRGHINFCTLCSDKLVTKIVFLSRLLPVVSFDVVSYGAGLTAVSLKQFSIATFFGMLPLTFVYNYFGSVKVVATGWKVAAGIFIVLMFFIVPRIIERYDPFSLKNYFKHD